MAARCARRPCLVENGWRLAACRAGRRGRVAADAWFVARISIDRRTAASPVVRLALEIPAEGLASDPGQLNGPPVISPDGKVVVLALTANGGQ